MTAKPYAENTPEALGVGAEGHDEHWTDGEIDETTFKDLRLGRRFTDLIRQISHGMGQSIPYACQDWAREQTHAVEADALAADIATEQHKMLWCDVMIFQFPMWWFGMPAILKGWVDRVFARGFAYMPGRKYDIGMMKGRIAMVSTTTGTSQSTYAHYGIDGAMIDVLWPIHNGMFRYTGFDVLPPHVAYMPGKIDSDARAGYLTSYQQRLLDIEKTPKLYFHPLSDYGPDERLKPGVVARSGFQQNG